LSSSCISLQGEPLDGLVSSIDTFGSGVKLYGDYDCSGDFAVNVGKTFNHASGVRGHGFPVRAFGSCQPNCVDSNKIETRETIADLFGERGKVAKEIFMVSYFTNYFCLTAMYIIVYFRSIH